jgi:hypothetical protein
MSPLWGGESGVMNVCWSCTSLNRHATPLEILRPDKSGLRMTGRGSARLAPTSFQFRQILAYFGQGLDSLPGFL